MPCPEESVVRAYAARTLPDEEAERFEEHYFACEPCWTRLQRTLELRGALADGAPAGRRAARRTPAGWPVLAAAAAIAAVAVGLWAFLPERGPALRGGADGLAPTVTAVEAGIEVQWETVDGADVYAVELFSEAGELLFSRETRETGLSIGSGELPATASGRPSFLKVKAFDELRQVLASSPLTPVPGPAGAGATGP